MTIYDYNLSVISTGELPKETNWTYSKPLCWPYAIFTMHLYKPLVNTIFWVYPSNTSHWILFFTIRFLSVCEMWPWGYEVSPGWFQSRFIRRSPWTRKCVVSYWASSSHLNPSHLSCRVNHIKKIDFIVWFLVFFFPFKGKKTISIVFLMTFHHI